MIVGGDVERFELKLCAPLETGAGRIEVRAGAWLRLRDADGRIGHGEAAPIAWLTAFANEPVATCCEILEECAAALNGSSAEAALASFPEISPAHPASRFALECALVDLAAQSRGIRAADWLAGGQAPRSRVAANALVSGSDAKAVRRSAHRQLERGFSSFKLKVGMHAADSDVRRVESLRETVGPAGTIRLDANGAWSVEAAQEMLGELARFGIEYVEDPIAIHTIGGVEELAALRTVSSIPLATDECVSSPALAHALIDRGACDVLVLKPSSLGGLRATRELVEAAQNMGIASTVTSSIDSAIGLSAVLHLAASLPGKRAACGLATAELLAEDIAVPPRLDRGYLHLSDEAGFGLTFAEAQS